jgi:hypothetical protein
MIRRVSALALLVGLVLGCGVLDELDKSSEAMDKYSPAARKAAEEKKKAEAEKKSGAAASTAKGVANQAKQTASQWWGKASSLAPDEADESIVRCVIAGTEQYTRRHDCQMRGGTVAKRN